MRREEYDQMIDFAERETASLLSTANMLETYGENVYPGTLNAKRESAFNSIMNAAKDLRSAAEKLHMFVFYMSQLKDW